MRLWTSDGRAPKFDGEKRNCRAPCFQCLFPQMEVTVAVPFFLFATLFFGCEAFGQLPMRSTSGFYILDGSPKVGLWVAIPAKTISHSGNQPEAAGLRRQASGIARMMSYSMLDQTAGSG